MTAQIEGIDAILAKVQKMLNVTGRSPEEAATYVEAAHALLAKYDLTIESVHDLKADSRTAVRKADAGTKTVEGKPDTWKADLLKAVAEAFECRVAWTRETVRTPGGKYRTESTGNLIGFGHDVEAAGYAQSFLIGEITRLAKEYSRVKWDEIKYLARDRGISNHDAESIYVARGYSHPLKAELYFIKGATQTVTESLTAEARRRSYEATKANPNALVVQKSDAIRDFVYQEAYGKTYAEYKAEQDARIAKWAAEEATRKPTGGTSLVTTDKTRPESPSARRRREEAEGRRRAREERTEWNRYIREQRSTDHSALRAGQEAGRTIKVRHGIGGGIGKERHVAE